MTALRSRPGMGWRHRPLGFVMRARKAVYPVSSGFRATHNGCPIHEPRPPADLPT